MGPDVRSGSAARGWRVPAVSGRIVFRGGLSERLGAAGRVTVVSAPAGSGKTVLVRWLRLEGELTEIRAADLRFSVEEARESAGERRSPPRPGLFLSQERRMRRRGCTVAGERSWAEAPAGRAMPGVAARRGVGAGRGRSQAAAELR